MTRQFQSKISYAHYTLLLALLAVAIYLIWMPTEDRRFNGALIGADLVLMVVIIEKMIHTTYTIKDNSELVIHTSRFKKDISIPIDSISKIDRISKWRIAGKAMSTSLVIVTNDGEEHHISPRNEEEFVNYIIKSKTKKELIGE